MNMVHKHEHRLTTGTEFSATLQHGYPFYQGDIFMVPGQPNGVHSILLELARYALVLMNSLGEFLSFGIIISSIIKQKGGPHAAPTG